MDLSNESDTLTLETLALIQGQEGRNVDFKAKPEGVKPEDFVAFANARGGCILVGVEEVRGPEGQQMGLVVGCPAEDRVRQMFVSMAVSCRPSIDINIRVENLAAGQPVFRIDIPEGRSKPYCTASGIYKTRADGQNIPIDPTMMRALLMEEESEAFLIRFRQAAGDLLEEIARLRKEMGKN